ncbi:BTAD domain-containing putative transcriptional regulator [Leucothrix pacifica]|uniref:Bacterial transcriptional activator domain-containing protein n=1 Tax=Leucothrix pacifica TaxID=1247513 RepID=A0A317C8X6_9GAMM|nr:BTAD domain-containing putative transcriptional regulator [Leucothrix pacifica]PWQ95125.1 hypothetical protein DKW60_15495 [Leucothrix pacifica]
MRISLLGDLQVTIDRVPVEELRGQRVRSIFIYLVLHAGTAVSRSELAGTLWPDISERQARTNLRRELHALKHTHPLINQCITASKNTVTWQKPDDYHCDVEEFGQLYQDFNAEQDTTQKSSLGLQAVALYRDPLLAGMSDEWICVKREALHRQWNSLSEHLITVLQGLDVSEQIIRIASRQLSFDPYLETAYLAIMEAYIASGNSAMALHTYHQCASVLHKDLGISPNERIQNLYSRLVSKNASHNDVDTTKSFASATDSALIGRANTVAEITDFIKDPIIDVPCIAFLTGESGIGKSRLADEVLSAEPLKQIIQVSTACHPARVDTVFGPFKDWLSNPYFLNACKETDELKNSTIQQMFPQLASTTAEPSKANKLTLRSQDAIFAALSNIVCTVAEFYYTDQQARLLLYIDDLQWADGDFFSWLHYFLSHQKGAKVIFLATVRSEEMDSVNPISGLIDEFSFSPQVMVKQLSYLNRAESFELINNQLAQCSQAGIAMIDPDKIFSSVRGNPLFLIESVKHLLNTDQAVSNNHIAGAAPTISRMLQRRISLLDKQAQQLLQRASVINRQFSLPLIQALTQFTDSQLIDALDALWERGMLREIGHGDYDFRHDSLREACYASLSKPVRRIMHGQIAKALETLNPDQTDNLAGEIANHYEKSGNTPAALDWYERALDRTKMTLAIDRCIAYGKRSLQLMDLTAPIADRADQQMKILSALSYAHSLKQGHACKHTLQACQEMETLLPYVKDPQTRWLTVFRLRVTATFSYQTYRALRLTAFQQSAASDTGDVANIIEAYKSRGFVLYQLGKLPEAFQCLDEGLNLARHAESQGKLDRYRPPWSLAMLSKIRIQVLYMMGRFEDALSAIQHDYDHAHCVGAPQFRAMVCMWVGKINLLRNQPSISDGAGKTIIAIGQQENLPEVESLGKFFCDWAEWKRGNTDIAITALKQTIKMNKSVMASNILQSFWLSTLAEMYYSTQQLDKALSYNSKGIQAVRLTRVPNRKADTYRMRGNILAAMNATPAMVIRLYDLSIKTSLNQSALMYTVQALVDKINYLQVQGLATHADLQQLREVIGKVQISADFAPLAVAQSLLAAPPD